MRAARTLYSHRMLCLIEANKIPYALELRSLGFRVDLQVVEPTNRFHREWRVGAVVSMPETGVRIPHLPTVFCAHTLLPPDHKRPRTGRRFHDIERRIAAHAREVVGMAGERADEKQPRCERKGGLNG